MRWTKADIELGQRFAREFPNDTCRELLEFIYDLCATARAQGAKRAKELAAIKAKGGPR